MLNTLGYFSLFACLVFVAVAVLADWVATHQMVHSRFRFVPVVRLCRNARAGAALMVALFLGLGMVSSPLGTLMAFLLACLLTLASQGRMLVVGAMWQAGLRCFLPMALVLGFLANLSAAALPHATGQMALNPLTAFLAVLSAVGFWFIAELRTQQDLLRLRD